MNKALIEAFRLSSSILIQDKERGMQFTQRVLVGLSTLLQLIISVHNALHTWVSSETRANDSLVADKTNFGRPLFSTETQQTQHSETRQDLLLSLRQHHQRFCALLRLDGPWIWDGFFELLHTPD